MPDIALYLKLMARHLESQSTALDEADTAHEAELSDDAAPRAERDEAEADARATVIEFRNAISAKYGDLGLQTLGIYDAPSKTAVGLTKYGRNLHRALLDARCTLTPSGRRGVQVDRAAMAEDLLVVIERLDAALSVVTKEAAELHLTQTAKDRAVDNNDQTFQAVASVAEGLLSLAGRKDLADRVRPSRRRPGVTEAEESDPAAT